MIQNVKFVKIPNKNNMQNINSTVMIYFVNCILILLWHFYIYIYLFFCSYSSNCGCMTRNNNYGIIKL